MKNISIKKVAALCAVVMVVSMVPIFAADTSNATTNLEKHLKHQYKYQNGLKNSDAHVNSDHAQAQHQNMNCTEDCAENQYKYGYLNKNGVNNCTGNCTS